MSEEMIVGGFDIEQQAAEAEAEDEGTEVVVKNRLGDPVMYKDGEEMLPAVLIVTGKNGKRFREIKRRQELRKIKPGAVTTAQFLDETLERVVYCTIGWRGFATANFNPSNLERLYRKCPWVYDDATEAMDDASRFTKRGSQN
jgi:hypothetical protein